MHLIKIEEIIIFIGTEKVPMTSGITSKMQHIAINTLSYYFIQNLI